MTQQPHTTRAANASKLASAEVPWFQVYSGVWAAVKKLVRVATAFLNSPGHL